jgi:hypothetical protein
LSEAHPAVNSAIEVRELIANKYKTPTFRSTKEVSLANGITAAIRIKEATIIIGTKVKAIRSAPAGIKSSFVISLKRSAIGCNNPNGPHLLGPILFWNLPNNRRSIQLTTAAPSKTALIKISIIVTPANTYDTQQGNSEDA